MQENVDGLIRFEISGIGVYFLSFNGFFRPTGNN